MLLKRSIVLAACVLLFIAAFIIRLAVRNSDMEADFKAERQQFGVEGVNLTAADGAPTPVATPTPAVTPDTNAPATVATPAAATTPDSTSTPDTNAAPAAQPDTNAAPAAPAASTRNDPAAGRSPLLQLASYRPLGGVPVQVVAMALGQTQTTTPEAPPATTDTLTVAPATVPAPVENTAAPKSAAAGEGSVIVLLYHQFKPAGVAIPAKFQWTMNQDVFAYEMKYIHDNGYNVISMDQLLKFIKHEGTVPPRAVCITVDDGYKSAVVYAAPIMKKYGYPWTFFIYPDFVTVAEGSGAVSWNDLLELQKEGIDIECHSMTHPILKSKHQKIKGVWHELSADEYAAWLNTETAGAKAELEQHLGKPVTCFAYPYGEYNTQVEDAVIAAGFEAIFTVADNPVHSTTSLHSIGRYTITQGVEKNFAAYLRQGALGLANADPAPGATTSNPRPVISATLGYAGTIDPKSIETSVRDFGDVKHDFDPATNTIRLYLPRDLIASVVLVNIRVRDASTQQVMVANWHFNYEPTGGTTSTTSHAPIALAKPTLELKPLPAPSTTPAPKATQPVSAPAPTNIPAATAPPEPLEKSAKGTPLDAHPVTTKSTTD